jgi:hypothetical protein
MMMSWTDSSIKDMNFPTNARVTSTRQALNVHKRTLANGPAIKPAFPDCALVGGFFLDSLLGVRFLVVGALVDMVEAK